MRTLEKSKGRRGGDREPFARLPESILQHPALATAPHAALRVLAILVCGYSQERNGVMMLSASYAETFGLTSHDTLTKSLRLLEVRGLITTTRKVQRLRRFSALYGVTWWPIWYRDGVKLDRPEPASHAYQAFIHPAHRDEHEPTFKNSPSRSPGQHIPLTGMKKRPHRPDLGPFQAAHHPAHRANSKNLEGGVAAATAPRASNSRQTEVQNRGRSRIAQLDRQFEALDAETEFLGRPSA